MNSSKTIIALDIGTVRTGVAIVRGAPAIPVPLTTIDMTGDYLAEITSIVINNEVEGIVVGYPRNQQGEVTKQTAIVESVVERLQTATPLPIVFQDESLTSVEAEKRLKATRSAYNKEEIDAEAARLLLEDYLGQHHYG